MNEFYELAITLDDKANNSSLTWPSGRV